MATQLSSLAVRPDLDPSKFVQGAQQLDAAASAAGKAVAGVGVASDEVNRKISQAGDVVGRLSRQYVDGYASAQRFQSALNSLSREMEKGNLTIDRAQPILDGIYKKYGLMGDAAQFAAKGQLELAAAITNANARMEQQRRIVPANTNLPQTARPTSNFAALNATNQFQDIAVTAAMGQNPLTIGLQQGTQLGAALQMSLGEQGAAGAAKVLGSALLGLFSPLNLVAIGLTAVVAAGIQFGSKLLPSVKSIDEVLKEHQKTVKELADAWGTALTQTSKYQNQAEAGFRFEMSTAQMRTTLGKQVPDVLSSISSAASANIGAIGGPGAFRGTEMFGLLKQQIDALVHSTEEGGPPVLDLTRKIAEMGRQSGNTGIRKLANDILVAIAPIAGLAEKLAEANRQLKILHDNVGPNGMLKASGSWAQADMGNLSAYQSQQVVAARRSQEAFDADMQAINARSPAERAAAARAQAAAQHNDDESSPARKQRIDHAGQRALIEAQHQLDEAQKQRKRSLDATLASQQLDLDLIGKTAGQTEAMRLQFQLTQQLREEAARNNIPVDQKELDLIKQKAEAYGKMADQIARARLRDDLTFDVAQLGRSPVDQQVAATQRQYGLAVDLNSADAAAIRYSINVKNIASAWNDVRNTGMDAIDQLTDSASKGFTDIGDVASNIAGEIEHDLLQLALANPLKNAIYGAGLPTLGSIGGAGGFFSALTGGKFNPGTVPGLGQSVGAMSVQAGIVNLSGTGLAGGLTGDISRLFAPANDNSLSAYGASIRSIESSNNYNALGPTLASGDRAYGAYGIMGSNIGPWSMSALGHSLTPDQFLGNPSAQDTIFQKIFGGYLGRFGNANDAASAWFTGRPLSSGADASDIFGTTGQSYVNQFNANLRQMAGVTASTTDNLSTFGGGLGQLGQNLQQAATSGGGSGGIFGALGHLFGFGGFANLFPAAPTGVPINSLTPADYGFADGTVGAPPGWAWVGERGPELMRFRGGEQVMPSHMSFAVTRGFANGTPGISAAIGGRPVVKIYDQRSNSNSQAAEVKQSADGMNVEVYIRDAVRDEVTRPSAKTNQALRGTYGLQQQVVRR